MKEASGVDIVTRLYDLADLPFLDQLVFSVMGQVDAGPLRLHVMLQRFSFADVREVRKTLAGVRRLHDQASVTLHNWDYMAPFDLRVPLLNWGMELAQGRYVICLDVHDHLRPHACAALLSRLRGTSASLALAGTMLQPVWWWGDVVLPVPGQAGEPLSGSIFMADSSRVAFGDRIFVSDGNKTETGEFIQRISTSYPVDTALQDTILAVRRNPLTSLNLHHQL